MPVKGQKNVLDNEDSLAGSSRPSCQPQRRPESHLPTNASDAVWSAGGS